MFPFIRKLALLVLSGLTGAVAAGDKPSATPLMIRLGDAPDIPLAGTHILELGQRENTTTESLPLTLTNRTHRPISLAVFGLGGSVKVVWDVRDKQAPANLKLLRGNTSAILQVTFVAHKDDAELPEVVLLTTTHGILTRVIVHAVVRSVATYTVSQSQYMASRLGDQWGDYYAICSGPPPVGYVIDSSGTSIRVHEHWEGYGARNCDKGMTLEADNQWTRCTTSKSDENGVCYAVSIQGYKADVVRIQHAWEYLTVRWRLKTQPAELR